MTKAIDRKVGDKYRENLVRWLTDMFSPSNLPDDQPMFDTGWSRDDFEKMIALMSTDPINPLSRQITNPHPGEIVVYAGHAFDADYFWFELLTSAVYHASTDDYIHQFESMIHPVERYLDDVDLDTFAEGLLGTKE